MFIKQQEKSEEKTLRATSAIPVPQAKAAASLTASALLAACGGGGGGGGAPGASQGAAASASGVNQVSAADADAARFLQQAQFSSTQAEIVDVRQTGYAGWLARQFGAPLGPTGWDWLEARGYGQVDVNTYFSNLYPADFMLWSQLMSGPDMMRRRMALALSEFFVVSLDSSGFRWRSHAIAAYWDMLVRYAFGNFRQLLEDVTLLPVMGYYLNTLGNQKEDPSTGRTPDENYAREVMQLFAIGLYQLNPDGNLSLDTSGNPLEAYSQSDVSNLARVFTGYNVDYSDGVRFSVPGQTATIESPAFARKPMVFNPGLHSTLEASFLGVTIPANTPGPDALKIALDTLFNHPNVGPFFARQMIQRLVSSNPSAAYVGRVAASFNNNGAGERGDLRAVWTAILLDDEARGPASLGDNRSGKLREPMLRMLQWARSFGVTSAAGSWKIFNTRDPVTQLGQSPFYAPSVFNFFRPGFIPPHTVMATVQAPAPEFQLVNETTVGGYLNYMQGVLRNGISCCLPDVPQFIWGGRSSFDVTPSYADELLLVTDAAALVRHLGLVLCAGQLSPATQSLIVAALNAVPLTAASTEAARLDRIAAAVLLVMACADYLIQK